MHRGKSSAFHEHIMAASSSSSDDNNNVSLGADQEEVPVSTRDTASSNVVSQRRGGVPSQRRGGVPSQRRGGVPSQQDLFTRKY